jgi:hypothetical protein
MRGAEKPTCCAAAVHDCPAGLLPMHGAVPVAPQSLRSAVSFKFVSVPLTRIHPTDSPMVRSVNQPQRRFS